MNKIAEWIIIISFFIAFLSLFLEWEYIFNIKVRCSRCGKKFPIKSVHQVVHGQSSFSDSWSEYFCRSCDAPDYTFSLSRHNVR